MLHYLEVRAAGILNACVTAPDREKIGPELGDDGKSAIIVRALFGLKDTGASFKAHLAQ